LEEIGRLDGLIGEGGLQGFCHHRCEPYATSISRFVSTKSKAKLTLV
jgi:hypothetical protein